MTRKYALQELACCMNAKLADLALLGCDALHKVTIAQHNRLASFVVASLRARDEISTCREHAALEIVKRTDCPRLQAVVCVENSIPSSLAMNTKYLA